MQRKRTLSAIVSGLCSVLMLSVAAPASGVTDPEALEGVLKKLNDDATVKVSDDTKSYAFIFDAYLNLSDPPMDVGEAFNVLTIHPGMDNWSQIAGWAEGNSHMAEAILKVRDTTVFGLPYGVDNVESHHREAGLYAGVATDGDLRYRDIAYLDAIDVIQAYVAAETYRRFEQGQTAEAIDLAMANLVLVRQLCDRNFLVEKRRSIQMLTDSLSNLRDQMYVYLDAISPDQFARIGQMEIPYLRPTRGFLFMPEGDRVVAEALIEQAFDEREQPDPERFREIFAALQAEEKPLTQFGAAKRWELVAALHSPREDSLNRLKTIYDDWWRRWRVEEHDPVLTIEPAFSRTNPVRYAAVLYAIEDLGDLFDVRKNLIAATNATAMSAGVAGYRRMHGSWPSDLDMTYGRFTRRISNADHYDRELRPFEYRLLLSRQAVDTVFGRLWLEEGDPVLYGLGHDYEDNSIEYSSEDGQRGDVLFWPPVRALAREQGLLD